MTLYIFDYGGTLTRLPEPVAFLKALRAHDPDAHIILFTGTPAHDIHQESPGLLEEIEALWPKPNFIHAAVAAKNPSRVVMVDDEPEVLSAYRRAFRKLTCPVTFLLPDEMKGLVPGWT